MLKWDEKCHKKVIRMRVADHHMRTLGYTYPKICMTNEGNTMAA